MNINYRDHSNQILTVIVFIIAVAVTSSGCDESLPPNDQQPISFSIDRRAGYDYYPGPSPRNQIKFVFTIKNVYDETIEDTLDLSGNVTVTWLTPTSASGETLHTSKTIQLNKAFITYIKGYNASTGIFTFDPEDSLVIEYNWNFVTDNNINLLDYFPAYPRGGPNGCKITPQQTIRTSGSVHLMKSRGNIVIRPFDYTYCFFTAEGDPRCADFIWHPCQ